MQPAYRLHQPQIFVAVFFQELRPRLEGKASIARRQQGEEKLRALAQRPRGLLKAHAERAFYLQSVLDVARQFVAAQIAYRYAEIAAGHVFQLVRLVKDHRAAFGQDAGIGSAFRHQLDGQVGKKQVMIDDDQIALRRPPMHLGDEAAVELLALGAGASFTARIYSSP